MDHVVRHVVGEHKVVLELVPILHLPVAEGSVQVQVMSQDHVQIIAVVVRL